MSKLSLTPTLAASPLDIARATALITSVYQKAGYARDGESSSISAFLSLPATITFNVEAEGSMLGTMSIVSDSPARLPMDLIFKDKLDEFRAKDLNIGEAGQFAIDRELLLKLQMEHPLEGVDRAVSLILFKLAIHYSIRRGFDLLCIAVNPKHVAFYRWMGFETFAETRDYPSVENAPAVPMKLDMKVLKESAASGTYSSALMTEIFKNPPEEMLLTQALAKALFPGSPAYPVPSRSA